MFSEGLTKVVLDNSYEIVYGESQEEVLHDCPERNLVIYHLLRMIRDLYINSKDGGQTGAYRKQCRTRRKSALMAILNPSEEPLTFRWSCKALGYNPDIFRNRILFDVRDVSDLMRDGVVLCESNARKPFTAADVWVWEDAPIRYQLSEKKGHYVVKMDKADADIWIASLQDSPLQFLIERFDLTSSNVILVLRHK
jgi:hypothetical protein